MEAPISRLAPRLGTLNRFTACIGVTICLFAYQVQLYAQSRTATSTAEKPNIIFILADDQGWNGTSVQMHPEMPDSKSDFYRTPNLEKLATRGIRFSHAYSPGPMCSPTRASLQTGKSPAQLHMTNVGRGGRPPAPSQRLVLPPFTSTLSTDEVTIGEMLSGAGYATAWFGKWHLGGDGPGAHGYDENDGPTGNANGNTNDPANPKDIFGITQRGMSFMEKNAKAGKPFYLQLWHYAVHGPIETKNETEQACAARQPGQTHASTTFAGMTEDLDTGVGMILDKIEELSISDNTYVIYMSDHGSSRNLSSNAPLNRGKGTLWEGGLRVPLIVSGPGVKSGVFCSVPTAGWDLFPTFCDLADVDQPLPKGLEGVSLKPLFKTGRGSVDRAGHPIAFHFPHYGQGSPQSTILTDGFKLMKLYDNNELHLFDLARDISERNDLATQKPEKTTELHQALNRYLASVNAGLPSPNPNFDPNAVAQAGPRRGRRGRRGPTREQIAERQKELETLEEAINHDDREKIGQLIANMKKAMESRGPRPGGAGPGGARPGGARPGGARPGGSGAAGGPRPGGAGATSPRQQRQQEIEQLEEAHHKRDAAKLRELVAEIKKRLESSPARPERGSEGRGERANRPPVEDN